MRFTQALKVFASTVLGLMAFAGSASATTLEVGGVKQTGSVSLEFSLKSGTSMLLSDTFGSFVNTCTEASVKGSTSVFTGTTVSGSISSVTANVCQEEGTLDTMGSFSIENISGTTNGTVRSIGAKVTTPSPFGTLTCVTASSPGTDMGTLTGVSSGTATMDVSASLNCGAITAKLTATLSVTSPFGLGVTS